MAKFALAPALALFYTIGVMLLRRGRLALAVSCVLCLPACGGTDIDAPGGAEANTSGAGGLAAAGQGTGGTTATSGAGGAGGASVGGSGGQSAAAGAGGAQQPLASCSSYMDASTWSLTIQIKNERTQPLYLGQDSATCDAQRLFQVEDGARTLLEGLEGCHSSCQALMQTGPVACPTTCASPSTITLDPGQTIKIPWDGRYGVAQSLPQQCLSNLSQSATSCVQAQRIEASVFTFKARAGTSRSCLAAGGCACATNEYGGCTMPSSLIAGTIITTEYLTKLEPGESPYISLVFTQ
jgi:hypothetical protein